MLASLNFQLGEHALVYVLFVHLVSFVPFTNTEKQISEGVLHALACTDCLLLISSIVYLCAGDGFSACVGSFFFTV